VALGWAHAPHAEGQGVDLEFHDARNLAVALGTAPDHAIRQGMFTQVVVLDLIGQRQVGRIEDAGLAFHEAQKARECPTSANEPMAASRALATSLGYRRI
jgi:hypothetical protein